MRTIAVLLMLLAVAGCGSGNAPQLTDLAGSLPPLPRGSGHPAEDVLRLAAMELTIVIHGSQFDSKSAEATVADSSMLLTAPAGEVAWAVYEIPGLAPDYSPSELELRVLEPDREYFVALADYTDRRWQIMPEPYTGDSVIEFTAGWERYAQPETSSVFYAVLVWGPTLTFNQGRVTIEDTRPLPAPRGLEAAPLSAAVELTWQPYGDPRADELRIWQADNEGMIDATLAATGGPGLTTRTIDGLTNGQTYYFALTAYLEVDGVESLLSNVASATPSGGTGGGPLAGIWPRLGNREDSRGVGTMIGPADFEHWNFVELTARETVRNRTSPVIDSDGNVFALTGDGVLVSYSADLSAKRWEFAASEHGTAGVDYVCPPHSPCLDANGNAYFIAAPVSTSAGTPYLFCVNNRGERGWRFDMGTVSDDIEVAYPTPNITTDGIVIAVIKENRVIVGIADGTEEWSYELGEAECHADPALSGDMLELPIWDRGIGIPESRLHWLRIDATSGDFAADYRGMGAPENRYGGLALPGPYHVFPENEGVSLVEPITGTWLENEPLNLPLKASPARSADSSWIFQPHPPFGFAGTAYLHVISVSGSDPPYLTNEYSLQLDQASVTGKPAVDGEGKIYLADARGKLYIIEFDQGVPPGPDNPNIMDEQALNRSDTYFYNSFAIGDGAVYIVTEQNVLYRVYARDET